MIPVLNVLYAIGCFAVAIERTGHYVPWAVVLLAAEGLFVLTLAVLEAKSLRDGVQ